MVGTTSPRATSPPNYLVPRGGAAAVPVVPLRSPRASPPPAQAPTLSLTAEDLAAHQRALSSGGAGAGGAWTGIGSGNMTLSVGVSDSVGAAAGSPVAAASPVGAVAFFQEKNGEFDGGSGGGVSPRMSRAATMRKERLERVPLDKRSSYVCALCVFVIIMCGVLLAKNVGVYFSA